eukprot:TRINITY_DN3290_c0_g1_i1.p1 TRINITY_DN3290_c0_g1~~TRINITY_DN3290_c0_g1_i1.p1  ORF type:complete len:628 (+),score=111.00 TRINITY_DN3290_c0_g1_i1:66-1886(+)
MRLFLFMLSVVSAMGQFQFSQHVASHMVLQQAPAKSSVYGTTNVSCSSLSATVTNVGSGSKYTVDGKVVGAEWIAYLKPSPAGGNFTITVSCDATKIEINDVTFGDVWYCGGQSNMALPLEHTISRNLSLHSLMKGKYSNIRIHQIAGNMNPDTAWMTAHNASIYNTTDPRHRKNPPLPELFYFSAACYYYAQSLTDELGEAAPPLGMIHTAYGGSTIQQWTSNATTSDCTDVPTSASSGSYVESRLLPFANMTLKGWVWYQGENNMHSVFGNTAQERGYACEFAHMIKEWRQIWSVEPDTTDPMAPFGLVTLAASGTEGGTDIGGMYFAQMGSYGVVPNPVMPNTFLAHAFDLVDPWTNGSCYDKCCPNIPEPGTDCTSCAGYCESFFSTPWYMGPIHPRDKLPVGERLAQAAAGSVYKTGAQTTGPVISGCAVEGNSLLIKFNSTYLGNDKLLVDDYYHPNTATFLQVLVEEDLFCLQTQRTSDKDSTLCLDDGTGKTVNHTGVPISTFMSLDTWPMLNVSVSGSAQITADLTPLNGKTIYGVRYAFFDSSYNNCCALNAPTSGPCPLAGCPLKGTPSNLPANPFIAKIVNGKCQCVSPMVCDE